MNAITNLSNFAYGVLQADNAIINTLNVGAISALSGSDHVTLTDNLYSEGIIIGNVVGNVTGNVIGNITGSLIGNVTGNVTGNVMGNITGTATNFSGVLDGDITGTQFSTQIAPGVIVNADISASAAIVDAKLATISTAGKVANSATTATSTNNDATIVLRSIAGTNLGITNFAGAVTGLAVGTFQALRTSAGSTSGGNSAISLMNAGATTNRWIFGLLGNETGSNMGCNLQIWNYSDAGGFLGTPFSIARSSGVVNIPSLNSNAATITTMTGNVIGNLTGNVTGGVENFMGDLAGDITGTQNATVIAPNVITNSMISNTAAIADTKLATITTAGKVANSATTATTATNAFTIVQRDSVGSTTVNILGANNIATKKVSINTNGSVSSALQIISGHDDNFISQGIGRTAVEAEIGVVAENNQFFATSIPGDVIIRNHNDEKNILLGIGNVNPSLIINASGIKVNGNINSVYQHTTAMMLNNVSIAQIQILSAPMYAANVNLSFMYDQTTIGGVYTFERGSMAISWANSTYSGYAFDCVVIGHSSNIIDVTHSNNVFTFKLSTVQVENTFMFIFQGSPLPTLTFNLAEFPGLVTNSFKFVLFENGLPY